MTRDAPAAPHAPTAPAAPTTDAAAQRAATAPSAPASATRPATPTAPHPAPPSAPSASSAPSGSPAPSTPSTAPASADLVELWERLGGVEERVRRAVAARRATDPDPDDPYRGQYLTAEDADRILRSPSPLTAAPANGAAPAHGSASASSAARGTRLQRLAADFGLTPLDVELLLVTMAPDVDVRFERLYGYLNDDLTRPRPTVNLALELCGVPAAGPGRFRFGPAAPLVAGGLVRVSDTERPLLSRTLRVPDRVSAHLLGDDEPDGRLHGLVGTGGAPGASGAAHPARGGSGQGGEDAARVAAAFATGSGLVHLHDRGGDAGRIAVEALLLAGRRPLALDVAALTARPVPADLPHVLATEARLCGGGIVLGPLDQLAPGKPEHARLLRDLCAAATGVPLITHGAAGWDPLWAAHSPVQLTIAPLDPAGSAARWRRALGAATATGTPPARGTAHTDPNAPNTPNEPDEPDAPSEPGPPDAPDLLGAPDRLDDLAAAVASYRLDSEQVRRAADVAVRAAALEGRPVRAGDLRRAVRAQNGAGLERLARRIEPTVGWDDLVLPQPTRRHLNELALRARHRETVLGSWGMRPGGGRGRGVIALFAGESGTGKTMSAEVVAADLGMDLYVVDLSTVVDKYIGETEKNLERIFTEAAGVNGILLFDEADAIFGKRSQVKDAHDRHANVESAYLLQRMESFDGIAVLTTNLRANLDEAFTRRLDVVAEFPMPDAAERRALWDRCLGPELPRGTDIDLDFCADRFELAGGSIRACAITAAYLAAESGRPLGMVQLVTAVVQEYRKLGRLVLESEFGPWLEAVRD